MTTTLTSQSVSANPPSSAKQTKSSWGTFSAIATAVTTAVTVFATPTLVEGAAWSRQGGIERSAATPDNRAQVVERILGFRDRETGWDGRDGVAPSDSAIAAALAFVDLASGQYETPRVFSAGDGEVSFSWTRSDSYLEIGFAGDRSASYLFKDAGTTVSDDLPFSGRSIPLELFDPLNRFVKQ